MPLYQDDGMLLDIISELKNNPKATRMNFSVSAKVQGSKNRKERKENSQKNERKVEPSKLEGHLVVLRLSSTEAKAASERCRKQASKKGRQKPTPDTLFLAGFLMVFTTLSPQILSSQTVLELYKCRWQIEMAIKRLKSLLDIDKLRSKEGPIADMWLNGMHDNARMVESHMLRCFGDDWGYLNQGL
jgi:IS4 transposase